MSYYNPKIYNYSNLSETDKAIVDASMQIALETYMSEKAELGLEEPEDVLEKIELQQREKALDNYMNMFLCNVVELIVSLLDNVSLEELENADIQEIDTNDFFYGYKWPDGFNLDSED